MWNVYLSNKIQPTKIHFSFLNIKGENHKLDQNLCKSLIYRTKGGRLEGILSKTTSWGPKTLNGGGGGTKVEVNIIGLSLSVYARAILNGELKPRVAIVALY